MGFSHRSTVWRACVVGFLCLVLLSASTVRAQDDIGDLSDILSSPAPAPLSDTSGGLSPSPGLLGASLPTPITGDATDPVASTSPPSTSTDSTTATDTTAPTSSKPSRIPLPTMVVIPPGGGLAPIPANLTPIFPSGSESCQKCLPYYPMLSQCNLVARDTLGRLPPPPLPANSSTTTASSPLASTTTISTSGNSTTATTAVTQVSIADANFTIIMPFLKCICPNQLLAASRVCVTCFRVSGQPNFLDQLVSQQVLGSLSAYGEVCRDSDNGNHVPASINKYDSRITSSGAKSTSWSRLSSIAVAVGVCGLGVVVGTRY